MSQEFEKIVLEKLNTMDKKLDEHTEEFKRVNKVLDEHTKLIKENTIAIENNTKLIKSNSREIEGLTEVVDSHTKSIAQVNKKIDSVLDMLEVHKNLFIKFEYDFDLKFKTLMDFFTANQGKHQSYDDTLLHYNSKILNHDIRILSLEDQIKNISITA
jgi:chromosome segregation ATPase